MPLDFPNTPTTGQTFTGPNGVIWSWDSAKWVNATPTGAYAPVASPVFTGDPQAPTAAAGDNDTSVATTAFVQAAVAPALHDVGRNLLHNSMFNIAQRGAGPFTTGYTLDRWNLAVASDTASITQAGGSDTMRAQIGDEQANSSLQNVFTGNAAAGALHYIMQIVEGVRRLSGKTVTLSFWAATSGATLKVGINFSQVFGTGGSPSANLWANTTGQSVTIGPTWTRYSVTTTLPSVAGKTLGTNNNDGTGVALFYSSGATNNATAGNIGVQSGLISLWGVQLEIGSVATPLEKLDPVLQLQQCQRFYQYGLVGMYGYSTAGSYIGGSINFPVQMRGTPTVTLPTPTYVNTSGFNVSFAAGVGFTWGVPITATGAGSVFGTFTASADL